MISNISRSFLVSELSKYSLELSERKVQFGISTEKVYYYLIPMKNVVDFNIKVKKGELKFYKRFRS